MIHVVRALTFQRLVSLYSGSIIIILFDSLSRKKWFANKIRRTSHIHNQYLIFNLLKFVEDRNLLSYNFRKITPLITFQFAWHYSFLNSSRSSLWSVRYFSRYSASRFQPSLKQFLAGTAILEEASGDFGKTVRLWYSLCWR